MAIRDDFFTSMENGALWDVAVSIKRGNPLPLDRDSIFKTYADLQAYAAGVLAYPGQIVAVVGETATDIYYLDQNLAIQPVGVIPTGDNKSIDFTDGSIAMHDYGKVFYKYIPETTNPDDGTVITEARYEKTTVSDADPWKAGLEPRVVTDGGQLVIGWYEPNPTTIEGVNDQVSAIQGTVGDLETSVGTPSDGDTPATGLYKEVEDVQTAVDNLGGEVGSSTDVLAGDVNTLWANVNSHDGRLDTLEAQTPILGVADADKVLAVGTDSKISAALSLSYDSVNKKIKLLGKDSAELSSVDATDFIKDGMLASVSYSADTNTLTFTWNTDAGIEATDIVLSDMLDPYTAGNGISITDTEIAAKVDATSETFLTVGAEGIKLSGVQTAIDAAKGAAQAAAEATAADLYATKTFVGTIPTGEAYASINTIVGYVDKKAEETLASANAASSAVSGALETYKTTNDAAVGENTTAIGTINNKLANIEDNAEKNIIEIVKVNNVALEVNADDRSVNISVPGALTDLSDWGTVDARITVAKSQADAAVGAAGANTAAIEAINNADTGILAQAKAYTDGKLVAATATALGMVKSSEADNKVKVETDGTMSLNRVSTDKLFVPEGSELILNGGTANE